MVPTCRCNAPLGTHTEEETIGKPWGAVLVSSVGPGPGPRARAPGPAPGLGKLEHTWAKPFFFCSCIGLRVSVEAQPTGRSRTYRGPKGTQMTSTFSTKTQSSKRA